MIEGPVSDLKHLAQVIGDYGDPSDSISSNVPGMTRKMMRRVSQELLQQLGGQTDHRTNLAPNGRSVVDGILGGVPVSEAVQRGIHSLPMGRRGGRHRVREQRANPGGLSDEDYLDAIELAGEMMDAHDTNIADQIADRYGISEEDAEQIVDDAIL